MRRRRVINAAPAPEAPAGALDVANPITGETSKEMWHRWSVNAPSRSGRNACASSGAYSPGGRCTAAARRDTAGFSWGGGDLQAPLNAAQPGDTILLEAGAEFVGNFVLPVKSGTRRQRIGGRLGWRRTGRSCPWTRTACDPVP